MLINRHMLDLIEAGRKVNEITIEDFDLLIEVADEQSEDIIKVAKLNDIKLGREENRIFMEDFDLLISVADNVLIRKEVELKKEAKLHKEE